MKQGLFLQVRMVGTWYSWPCDPLNADDSIQAVREQPRLCPIRTIASMPRIPMLLVGFFDLADIGLEQAHFIRIQDSGANTDGGFDLDAVSAVHWDSN